jgi:hypothetical protein
MTEPLANSPAPTAQPAPSGDAFPSPSMQAQPVPQASAPTRPEWVSDQFWDDKTGVKGSEFKAHLDELTRFKADADAHAAQVPLTADSYTTTLPADFKLPEGWSINEADPTWMAGKEFAKANSLTQDQFAGLAKLYVEQQIAAHDRNEAEIAGALKTRDEALGANGAARVDALNTWFKGTFGDKVGAQLGQTLFTPDIVGAFEKIQRDLTNQGAVGFRQDGRVEARTDGRPEGWEQMSALDQRTWNLANRR